MENSVICVHFSHDTMRPVISEHCRWFCKNKSTQIAYTVQYNIVITVIQVETQINNRKTSYCYRGAATFWNASTATGVLRVLFFITALALRIHKIIIIPNFVTINFYKKNPIYFLVKMKLVVSLFVWILLFICRKKYFICSNLFFVCLFKYMHDGLFF